MRVPKVLWAVLIAMLPAPAAEAAFPGANGRISFSSQGDLWTVAPDGAGLTRLTTTPEDEAQSAFSPDGTQIAYRRRPADGGPFQLYVVDADGANTRRVSSETVNATQPGWSADGRQLVYRRSTTGDPNADIWTVGLDGTGARALVTTPGADERYPTLSPDGIRLAFTSNRDGQYEVYGAAADGSGPTRLTNDPGYDSAPSWSPDAGRLAFERGAGLDDDVTKDVWIMDATGGRQVQLTVTAGVDEGPAFSPDGTQIAFTSGRDGNYEIYRMGADGSNQARVLALATMEESPDWQPLTATVPPPDATVPPPDATVPPPDATVPPPGEPSGATDTTGSTSPSTISPIATLAPVVLVPASSADRDRDGLSAGRERARRTSDIDRDSDDDGLSDGAEVRRTHTDPHRRDSDRDGLPDGLERGVTRAVGDPPGPVRGTDRRRFDRDADPRTRTDPRRRDSDRDGLFDGREDANRNGRRDRGESDPRRR